MKKAIYIGLSSQINSVYSAEAMKTLGEELIFPHGNKTFTKAELKDYDLKDVSFLFSTWGMRRLPDSILKAMRWRPILSG